MALPPLGAGSGGLAWSAVRPMIIEAMSHLPDVRVLLYEPVAPSREMPSVKERRPDAWSRRLSSSRRPENRCV